jgi:Predicted membrane protein
MNVLRYYSEKNWRGRKTSPLSMVMEGDLHPVYAQSLDADPIEDDAEHTISKDLAESSVKKMLYGIFQIVSQFFRFGLVGGLNTVIDLAAFNVFLWFWPTHSTMLLLAFNSFAYALGGVNSFVLNKYWTFKQQRTISPGEVVRFLLTTCVGIVCNDLIIWIMSNLVHPLAANPTLGANVSKIVAIFGTMCISYLGMRLWVFVKPAQTSKKEQ